MIEGQCQCQSIRFSLMSIPFECCYCHCSICRKLTGSSYGTYGTVPKSDFKWLQGEGLVSNYSQNENLERSFCSVCGSLLKSEHHLDPSNVFLSLGCLESASEDLTIEYQQFVESKASWHQLDPKIKSHRKWPKWALERAKRNSLKNMPESSQECERSDNYDE